eukprot:442827-Prymnesium_polylepis.1
MHGEGGGKLVSVEDLDGKEGCPLKLWDSAWLDANLGAADAPPLHGIRPPPSDFPIASPQRSGAHRLRTRRRRARSGLHCTSRPMRRPTKAT